MSKIYQMAKDLTGNAMIEDNSACMNQVNTDWYDCHIYRDIDDYDAYLESLVNELRSKPEIKPYMSGEDLDCDTYRDLAEIRREWVHNGQTPWWLDTSRIHSQDSVEKALIAQYGADMPAKMIERQGKRSQIVRKKEIESTDGKSTKHIAPDVVLRCRRTIIVTIGCNMLYCVHDRRPD